tara:strand:- start:851 stop:1111 length:261 start_codon:yes stop_codon:yes gene_type:complete
MIKLRENIDKSLYDNKIKLVNNIEVGKYIKIKNCKKTFQIVGLNQKKNICWVREWPLKKSFHKTFEVSVNNIFITTTYSFEKKDNK